MQFKDPVKFKEKKNTLSQSYEGITSIFSLQINDIAWAAFHIIDSASFYKSRYNFFGEVTGSLVSISAVLNCVCSSDIYKSELLFHGVFKFLNKLTLLSALFCYIYS